MRMVLQIYADAARGGMTALVNGIRALAFREGRHPLWRHAPFDASNLRMMHVGARYPPRWKMSRQDTYESYNSAVFPAIEPLLDAAKKPRYLQLQPKRLEC